VLIMIHHLLVMLIIEMIILLIQLLLVCLNHDLDIDSSSRCNACRGNFNFLCE
ncbi:hypothetical protein LOTGIDRAFT_144150, partial [Lottia gigantea]